MDPEKKSLHTKDGPGTSPSKNLTATQKGKAPEDDEELIFTMDSSPKPTDKKDAEPSKEEVQETKYIMHYVGFDDSLIQGVMWASDARWPPAHALMIVNVEGVAMLDWNAQDRVPGYLCNTKLYPPREDEPIYATDYQPYKMII